jgi:hypothetical protein
MLSSDYGISSVAHQLSCFGVGFSLCLNTGGLFLCFASFLWGKVSDPSAGPLLSVCSNGLLIVFQFCTVIWVWMLLLPAVGPSAFPAFVYWKFVWRSASRFSPFLRCASSNSTPLLCVSFQFLVYCSGFLFVCFGGSVSLPGCILGVAGEYHMTLGAYLFVCQISPRQVWSQHLVAQQPSCFLSVTWHGETFHGVQGVEVLILLAALFPPFVAPVSQWVLESWSSCCLLLCPSHHLGSGPHLLRDAVRSGFSQGCGEPQGLSSWTIPAPAQLLQWMSRKVFPHLWDLDSGPSGSAPLPLVLPAPSLPPLPNQLKSELNCFLIVTYRDLKFSLDLCRN